MLLGRGLAHLSDLHIGSGPRVEQRASALSDLLISTGIERLLVTGDITHRGRQTELARFEEIFAPWIARGKLTAVPGNHDCLGDGIAARIMSGQRVVVEESPGLHLVLVNSTGPHNRSWIAGHGLLGAQDMKDIDRALEAAAPDALVVVMLHHHVVPLPGEDVFERFFSWVGWPFANELGTGGALIRSLRGRCDLLLHGHRHRPVTLSPFPGDDRPLTICNAGSSTALGSVRVFTHQNGRVLGEPRWLDLAEQKRAFSRPAVAAF